MRQWFATGPVREGLKGRKEQKRAKVEQDLANCVGTRRIDVFGRSKEKLVWYGGDTCALVGLVANYDYPLEILNKSILQN